MDYEIIHHGAHGEHGEEQQEEINSESQLAPRKISLIFPVSPVRPVVISASLFFARIAAHQQIDRILRAQSVVEQSGDGL